MLTPKQAPRPEQIGPVRGLGLRGLPPIRLWLLSSLAFALLMFFVKPVAIGGDSAMYADDIEKSLPHGWSETHELWNFAHVMWRPLGRLLAEWFLGVVTPHLAGNVNMGIGILLILPNLIAALVCALTLQAMIWKMTGNAWASLLACVAFLCLNPLLNYSRLGSPYIVGIAGTTLATYFASFHPVRSWWTALLAGVFAGASVLCWAPFLVSFPAIVFSIWLFGRNENAGMPRLRFAALVCAATGGLVVVFYAFAMGVAGIHGISGLLAWIHESTPDSRNKKLLRMASGMARGFYELGDDSVWLKWYILRDPYAKVGIMDLVRESLARIALFYAALLGLAVLLWHSPLGRRLLLFITIAALPHLAVASLYESGSVERYVGILPAIYLGFGYAIGSAELGVTRQLIAALLCCLHIPFNVAAASERNVGNVVERDPARLAVLSSLPPHSRVFVINGLDPLMRLSYGEGTNPLHQLRLASVNSITPSLGPRVPFWRRDFACVVLLISNQGGEVWMTKRVLSPQPQRKWLWVEGDVPGLTWSAIQAYFRAFDSGIERGGPDGFFRVSPEDGQRQRLLADVEASGQACPP